MGELTLEELARINSEEAIETEVFVHGALCCSMSGQCLMSSMIGGRSGNRGACAQPCRKEYRHGDSEDWQYYLSLKDLCTLELIPDLVKAGVDSFKIEGRMKKPEYVAITTYLYKKYLSYYYEYGESYYKHTILSSEEYRKDLQSLKEIYNRGGFTKGYLVGELDDKVMLSGILPSHEGVAVGEVSTKGTKKDSMVDVRYTELIHPQDVLAIRDEKGVVLHEYTTKEKVMMGQIQRINVGYHKDPIEVGNTLYRIRNNALIREIEDKFPSQTPLIAISGKFSAKQGEPIVLEVWKDGEEFNKSCALGGFAQQAKKHGATRSDVETKICVSGDSIFRWKELSFDMEEGLFLSGSELKQLRRTAFQMLTDSMVQRYHRSAFVRSPEEFQEDVQKEIEQIGECRTREQWKCLNDHQRITTIYYHIEEDSELEVREMLEAAKKPLWFVLPRVLRQDTRELFLKKHNWIDYQTYNMFSGLVVSSLEELELFRNIVRLRTLDNLDVRN